MIKPVEEPSRVIQRFADPVEFCKIFWPQFTLYDKQREIMYSVRDNYETIVPAGNELGKDFISGLIVLWFFCSRRPCRIVTTSASGSQLEDVLWGEIRRFKDSSKFKLPIQYNHMHIRQLYNDGSVHPSSVCVGKVAQKGESMLGMHEARTSRNEPTTLLVVDEASGVDDEGYEKADTWTHRKLVIGNPYQCSNFFSKGVKAGNLESERSKTGEEKLYRNVIKIAAKDSPNIRLALAEIRAGKEPSHKELIPGLARYSDYLQRRKVWDKVRQCIGLDAEFYEGVENLLFPPEWLKYAETLYVKITVHKRTAKAIGIDPAEGGDSTCFAAVDEIGLIELISKKTPNTAVITNETLAFMRAHHMNPSSNTDCSRVCFDRGGGGKQHADRLREDGYNVRTVGFGQSPTVEQEVGVVTDYAEVKEDKERRYAYFNKRAELYGRLSMRLNPSIERTQFAIPKISVEYISEYAMSSYDKLRQQLSVIPLIYDSEGKLKLPPKNKKTPNSKEVTLIDLIGYSPDEADAVVLAVYAMEVDASSPVAGAMF